MTDERQIGVEITTSWNFPPVEDMRGDVKKLEDMRAHCEYVINGHREQIEKQRSEQQQLTQLSVNPIGEDGIKYDAQACAKAAERCDKHIRMFGALIKKERAKIDQLAYMVKEIEERIWLSERT